MTADSTMQRVYVKVNSDFDTTGYMQPRSITWLDGRTFPIDVVRNSPRPQLLHSHRKRGRKTPLF